MDEVDFIAVHILPFWNGIPVAGRRRLDHRQLP